MTETCFAVGDLCIQIRCCDGRVAKIAFAENCISEKITDSLVDEVKTQIIQYMSGERKYFDFPYYLNGPSDFAETVYEIVNTIPYGSVMTYMEVAKKLGDAKKARAVGRALSQNPLLLLIPCHRVVKSDGSQGGFAFGADIKKRLLLLEDNNK